MDGKIKLIIGCMFASKSSAMLDDLDRYRFGRKKCIAITFARDFRYQVDDGIQVHSGRVYKHKEIKALLLAEVDEKIAEYDVIGVDELQFYDDAIYYIKKWANAGKIVICAGLSGDYKDNPFKVISEAISISDEIEKRSAVCVKCAKDAYFTRKINEDIPECGYDIGGQDKYIAVCRQCANA